MRLPVIASLVLFVLGGVGCAVTPAPTEPPANPPAPTDAPTAPNSAAPTATIAPIVVMTRAPIVLATPTPSGMATTAPTPTGGQVVTDPTLAKLIADAKADLVTRANVTADEITVVSAEPVEWRDASLGCPVPGVMYAQMITPGYKIVLEANGEQYNYHASTTTVKWCKN